MFVFSVSWVACVVNSRLFVGMMCLMMLVVFCCNIFVVDFVVLFVWMSEVLICVCIVLYFGIGSINVAVFSNNKSVKIFLMIVFFVGLFCLVVEK